MNHGAVEFLAQSRVEEMRNEARAAVLLRDASARPAGGQAARIGRLVIGLLAAAIGAPRGVGRFLKTLGLTTVKTGEVD
jgi:hypothetical protein